MSVGCPQSFRAGSWHRKCDNSPVNMDAHTVLGTSGTPEDGSWHCPGHRYYPKGKRSLQTSENIIKNFRNSDIRYATGAHLHIAHLQPIYSPYYSEYA